MSTSTILSIDCHADIVDDDTSLIDANDDTSDDELLGSNNEGNDNSNAKHSNYAKNEQEESYLIIRRKIVSLSLSILLAAVLQTVRCIASLLDDVFRTDA